LKNDGFRAATGAIKNIVNGTCATAMSRCAAASRVCPSSMVRKATRWWIGSRWKIGATDPLRDTVIGSGAGAGAKVGMLPANAVAGPRYEDVPA
jgi:hypothetical protein